MTEHQDIADRLEELLNRQLGLYGRLRSLADRQHFLVAQDDPQSLLVLLGQRQEVVDQLAQLSTEVLPVQSAWRRVAAEAQPQRKQRLEVLIGAISDTLQSVLDSDAEDARSLAARKEYTRQSMDRVLHGQQALGAYRSATVCNQDLMTTDHSV